MDVIAKAGARAAVARLYPERDHPAAGACDPGDALGHGALALMLLHMGRHDEAMTEADLAVNLNPNSALAYGNQGASRAFGGRPNERDDFPLQLHNLQSCLIDGPLVAQFILAEKST